MEKCEGQFIKFGHNIQHSNKAAPGRYGVKKGFSKNKRWEAAGHVDLWMRSLGLLEETWDARGREAKSDDAKRLRDDEV